MIKHLQFSKIQMVERTGALMLVWFLDSEGNMYDWAPKWKDAEQVFLKGISVERFNKPESEWLNKFATTAQQVVEGAQRINSARKFSGRFEHLADGQLVVGDCLTTPGFDITVEFLEAWLGSWVDVLEINGIAIRLREVMQDKNGEPLVREYPEQDTSSTF